MSHFKNLLSILMEIIYFFFKACAEASAEPPRSLRNSKENVFLKNASLRRAFAEPPQACAHRKNQCL